MTKTVLDNAMVAHVWAQQSQHEGRSHNGNFSFRGAVLVSYRTPIATIVKGAKGQSVALITPERYSITTGGKHLPACYRAVSHLPSFIVPHLGVRYSTDTAEFSASEHAANLAALVAQYNATRDRFKRMRDMWRDEQGVSDDLGERAAKVMEYRAAFKLHDRIRLNPVADARAIMAERAEREAKRNTPQAIAKRARERERKAAKVRADYRAGKGTYYTYSREYRRIEALMNDEDKAARAASINAANAAKVVAWYAGEPNGHRFDADEGGAALRIRGDMLETSHGASVPLDHAKRAFRFLKLCRERGQAWDRNGHSLRVGHFTIEHVDADGSFRAGCHNIKWAQVERVAKLAGVFDDAASDTALEAK